MSATSPSSRTRAMMAATLSLTSAACSRFKERSALKRSSKSASPLLSHRAMARRLRAACAGLAARAGTATHAAGLDARMLGLGAGAPRGAKVFELGLDALDVKLDRGIAGEGQRH